ncbi:nucleotide-binding protein [Paenibacillus filicis]|uniref:Nucleotide-binding protein n=1 Tax=Paenibacillus gyeongsangnamensis TaxID=3388067 RepID=A0ABT4QCB5_9BACL|nr:nucleotide-binding protein [Paenibacillus filicis]MCZ8514517.1 nucleotide-binding protein [Paenibacillus filicis]
MMDLQSKPKLFIGSAKESIPLAAAVHEALRHYAEVSPWYAGTFNAMNYTMEDLEAELGVSDYAVFICSPDDVVLYREKLVLAPRDNTVFEMGLFWGKLRRGRVFFLVPQTAERTFGGERIQNFHLLSDMQGLTLLTYETGRADGSLARAVSVACMRIGDTIQRCGKFHDPYAALEEARLELAAAADEMETDFYLHQFFIRYAKRVMNDSNGLYEHLYDAFRSAYRAVPGYNVVGAAVWKANRDGLEQVAGNVGKKKSYPFKINEQPSGTQPVIQVVEAYLQSLEKFVLLHDHRVVKTYLICYPVGKDLLLAVHISGRQAMSGEDVEKQLELNEKLLSTINDLFGGDT